MQVKIRNRIFDFDLNSIEDKWQTQNGTFAFPINIGNTNCFLKKFNANDSATDFLEIIKGKEVNYLPAVFDIQKIEDQEIIVFQSFSEGKLYDDKLKDKEFRENLNLNTISKHFYTAIKQIHDLGFWHNDFCSHNILSDIYGNNMLLDLDSCIPIAQKVTTDFIINQSLFGIFRNYLIDYHQIDVLDNKNFNGINYNHLQLASLLSFLQYLILNPSIKYNSQLESNSDAIAEFIASRNPKVSEIFLKGITQPLTEDDYKVLLEYLPVESDLIPKKKPKLGNNTNTTRDEKPNVIEFKLTPNKVEYGGNLVVEWHVENAKTINIEGIGDNLPNKGGYELQNIKRDLIFILKVGNITKQIKVFVNDPIVPAPIIKIFRVNDSNSTIFLNKGEKYTVKWDVLKCSEVLLDEKKYKPVDSVDLIFSKDRIIEIFPINRIGRVENKIKSSQIKLKLQKLLSPIINKLEINGSKSKNFTFNEGETFDVSWNVSNATKVYLNGAEVKPVGITSRILRKNEILILEAINERDKEIIRTKSTPINLVVRKKAESPKVRIPEIIEFGIAVDENNNSKNPFFTHLPESNFGEIDNRLPLYFYAKVDKGDNGIIYFKETNYDRLHIINTPEIFYIPFNLLRNKTGVYSAMVLVKYIDGWEKEIISKIDFNLVQVLEKPVITKFSIIQNNKEFNFASNSNLTTGSKYPNESKVTLTWDTKNSIRTILSIDGISSDVIPAQGSKVVTLVNSSKKEIVQRITLISSNDAGTVKKDIDFKIDKKRNYTGCFIILALIILTLLYLFIIN